jgi:hypothetical protein
VIEHTLTDDAVTITDRWTYAWAAPRRPFLHPVLAPHGAVLTVDAPDDHPWHHGLWFTIKFVNGENFWEEYDEYGVLRHDAPPQVDAGHDTIAVRGALRWIRPDRTTVVIDEARTITHREVAGGYSIDLDTTLTPRVDVLLDRTPFTTWGGYGGLTLRGAPDWHDTRLRLSDGSEHEQIHGAPARWCELAGDTATGPASMALLDHPGNPRHPVPWYASTRADTYGDGWANFANAAFLWDGPLALGAGEPLRFRYRVLVQGSRPAAAALDAAYDDFAP